jgi:hypothetical protein
MKTLIIKPARINERKSPGNCIPLFFMTFVFLLLSFILSGSSVCQQKNIKAEDAKNRKLDILEKLENGGTINSENIRSMYGDFRNGKNEEDDILNPIIQNKPERFSFPDMHSFHGALFYRHNDDNDHVIISDDDLKEIHEQMSEIMEELKRDIESISNSESFLIIHDNLKRWNDNLRKELDKMKEELIRSAKEVRNKEMDHNLL